MPHRHCENFLFSFWCFYDIAICIVNNTITKRNTRFVVPSVFYLSSLSLNSLSCLLYLLYTAVVVATTATAESATIVNEGAVAVTAAGGGEGTATLFSVLSDTIFADGTVLVSSPIVIGAIIWSGIAVNAVAPFLQVQGQQIVGPTKCQTIYASQPLCT